MARIVIEDLPILEELSREEMAGTLGGGGLDGLSGGDPTTATPTPPVSGLPTDGNR